MTTRDAGSQTRRTLDAAALGERPVGPLLWHACTQTTIAVGTLLLVKVPLVLVLGRSGPTGTWTGLAAGELLSAGIALLVLRRLDVPAVRRRRATSTPDTVDLPLVQ